MDYGVDAVFIGDFCRDLFSNKIYQYTEHDFNALKEVMQRGIAIIYNGVRSSYGLSTFTSPRQEIFEKLEGKGLLFTGSQHYDSNGEETFEQWPVRPDLIIINRLLLTPTRYALPANDKDIKIREASPTNCLAAFALLKQQTKDRRLSHTTDDLLKILYDSGHDLTYFSQLYKVLDIPNALEYAEGRKRGLPFVVKRPAKPTKAPVPSVLKRPTGVRAPIQKSPVTSNKIVGTKATPIRRPARSFNVPEKNGQWGTIYQLNNGVVVRRDLTRIDVENDGFSDQLEDIIIAKAV